jgi:lysophospholipase L1-like esterase
LGLEKDDPHLKALFKKYDLQVVYLKDKLGNIPLAEMKSYFHDEIHLSPLGHQAWAKLITPDIQKAIQIHEKESVLI